MCHHSKKMQVSYVVRGPLPCSQTLRCPIKAQSRGLGRLVCHWEEGMSLGLAAGNDASGKTVLSRHSSRAATSPWEA